MRVVLVPVANRPESKVTLTVAAGMASALEGDVIACHLRPSRNPGKEYKSRGLPLFGGSSREALSDLAKKGTEAGTETAKKMFNDVVAQAGLAVAKQPRAGKNGLAIWRQGVGSPDKLMAIMGPMADLIVVSRPSSKGRVARMFLLAALLQTGRPVLVLPPQQQSVPGKRIAIAWNQSIESSRIVHGCMPLLAKAEQVTIITAGDEFRVGPKASQLQSYLRHYGVSASVINTKGKDEEKEMQQAFKESKSDLLLMGAYSRTRLREVVFGGMTERMLWDASFPVIMQHN